jgi:hypothetical protein
MPIHPQQQRVEVLYRQFVQKSDLFADDPTLATCSYALRSCVSLFDFGAFVAALKGERMMIKKHNFSGLLQLSDEIGFEDFATLLSQYRETCDFQEYAVRLSVLEERMDRLEALVGRVAVPLSAAEVLEVRMQGDQKISALRAEMSALLGRVAGLEAELWALRSSRKL